MVYQWAVGAHIKADAQVVGERVEAIRARSGGSVTPEQLVEDGRDEASPLHTCFEWDNERAADKYRLQQAGHIIRCLTIEIPDDRREPVRALVSVTQPDGERAYTAVTDAMADPAMRAQVMNAALSEIKGWRRRYTRLEEFGKLFTEIDQLDDSLVASSV